MKSIQKETHDEMEALFGNDPQTQSMMLEVLDLLLMDAAEHNERPSEPEVPSIWAPNHEEFNDLKKRLRMKEASRRFRKRKKDVLEENAERIEMLEQEILSYRNLCVDHVDSISTNESSILSSEIFSLDSEAQTLQKKRYAEAVMVLSLAEQVLPRLSNSGVIACNLHKKMKSVGALLPWQDQYNIAEANIKLFCVEMTKCLELLSIRSGWETYHLVGNGRVWMLASKRLLGVTRKDLGTIIWRNALQKDTRMIICQICDNFEVINRHADNVVVTEEIHKYPPPFLDRKLTCICGINDDGNSISYCKQTICLDSTRNSWVMADELSGAIVQDLIYQGEQCVHIDLLGFYCTKGLSLATVMSTLVDLDLFLLNWERSHLPELS